MRRAWWICLIAMIAVAASPAAADFSSSKRWFLQKQDEDRGVIQIFLIMLGHYRGLVDGTFGRQTFDAIRSYEASRGLDGDGVLSPAEEEQFATESVAVLQQYGFEEQADPRTGIKLFIPVRLLTETSSARWGTNWHKPDGSIELETLAVPHSDTTFADLYKRLKTGAGKTVDYDLLTPDLFVLSGGLPGRRFYTAIRAGDVSRGFSVSWTPSQELMGSALAIFLASMVEYPELGAFKREAPEAGSSQQPPVAESWSGTGFAISEFAIVTNAHVAASCQKLEVSGVGDARLVVADEERDLAVITVGNRTLPQAARIQAREPELGQAIVSLGYPLSDLMGSALSVSPGVVGSLSGLGGDQSNFTISANVQPGNSGGPVLDANGDVVGVTVSKFNEAEMLSKVGTTGANLGFAIDTSTLLAFLSPFKTTTADTAVEGDLSVQAIVAKARGFTYQIICHNERAVP